MDVKTGTRKIRIAGKRALLHEMLDSIPQSNLKGLEKYLKSVLEEAQLRK